MSEELTKEGLDELEKLLRGACGGPLKPFVPELRHLLSMARRALEAEERLEKAVEALRRISTEDLECGNCTRGGETPEDVAKYALMSVNGPKAIRPPQECAPPEGTDVPPVCKTCNGRGGWEGGLAGEVWHECTECNGIDPTLNDMRKGLDDHSCNSTGWGKP